MAGFCREDILMEDNDILVVHKHAGMAVQNARMGQMDLEHALLNYLAKQARAETPGQARTAGRWPFPQHRNTIMCTGAKASRQAVFAGQIWVRWKYGIIIRMSWKNATRR